PVAVFDYVEVGDRLVDLVAQALGQLGRLARGGAGIAPAGGFGEGEDGVHGATLPGSWPGVPPQAELSARERATMAASRSSRRCRRVADVTDPFPDRGPARGPHQSAAAAADRGGGARLQADLGGGG